MSHFWIGIWSFAAGMALALLWAFWRITQLKALQTMILEQKNFLEASLARERDERQQRNEAFRLAAFEALQNASKDLAAQHKDLQQQSVQTFDHKKEVIEQTVIEMRSRFEETQKMVQRFESERQTLYGRLESSMHRLLSAEESLRTETEALKRALTSNSGIRGSWGEKVLERILEENDFVRGSGYDKQVALSADTGDALRADFVIYLPGQRRLVIDSKEVAGEYLLAQESATPEDRQKHLQSLVANIRNTFNRLSRKEYQSALDPDMRFVVMFISSEGAIRAAYEADPALFQEAKEKHVVLASPMTLIPLVQLIAHTWQQQKLADNAALLGAEVEKLGQRLYVFAEHLQNIQSGLRKANDSWRQAVSSWQSRVSPQLERVKNLGGKMKSTPELSEVDDALPESSLQKNANLIE